MSDERPPSDPPGQSRGRDIDPPIERDASEGSPVKGSDPRPAPLALQREEPAEPCPNCRTPLSGPHAVLCPSCGYDLVRLKQHATVVGRPVAVDEIQRDASGGSAESAADGDRPTRPPLVSKPAAKLPLGIAALGIATLIALALAGLTGLFPREAGHFLDAAGAYTLEAPRWIDRIAASGKLIVQAVTLAVALGGGVLIMAGVRRSPLGDWTTFAARIAAIAVVSQLALLVVLPPPALERTIELVIQAALVMGLVLLWFRFTWQETAQTLGATLVLLAALRLLAWAVVWAA